MTWWRSPMNLLWKGKGVDLIKKYQSFQNQAYLYDSLSLLETDALHVWGTMFSNTSNIRYTVNDLICVVMTMRSKIKIWRNVHVTVLIHTIRCCDFLVLAKVIHGSCAWKLTGEAATVCSSHTSFVGVLKPRVDLNTLQLTIQNNLTIIHNNIVVGICHIVSILLAQYVQHMHT